MKSKGERERYTQLNAKFQRIARRDKKAFISEQCKEMEENNKKTRDLKKIGDMKGTLYKRMGTIKDKNSKDLTEAEEMKKRWQEDTEKLYKKGLNDPNNHDGVITHPEQDILKCEVKWILGNIQFSSVQFSRLVVSDSLQPHESKHARPPWPSPSPGAPSDSRPSSP